MEINVNQVKIESLAEYINEIGIITNMYNKKNQIILSFKDAFSLPSYRSMAIGTEETIVETRETNQEKYDQYSKDYYQLFDDCENSFFYRGQANIEFVNKVCPTIYRSTEKHDERYYMNNLDVRCFSELMDKHGLSKLTYLQHYGCPTRLLDISANPLVALFFACNGDDDKDGIIFAICTQEQNVAYSKSDKVLLLTKLSELSTEHQNAIRKEAYKSLAKGGFEKTKGPKPKYKNTFVESFYHSVKRDHAGFERDINPLDLLKPLIVRTPLDNPRILKQDGAFIICGLDYDEKDSNHKIKKFVQKEIIIPSDKKKLLLSELESVCITEATLFPELEKVSNYLKNKNV